MEHKRIKLYAKVFISVSLVYVMICILAKIFPFGNSSNFVWDLNIQYVDFFSYFRNVLLGKAKISYSMNKALGGSDVALYGYYLASPLNFLVLFFKQENMQWFIFFLTMIKLTLCGTFFCIFICNRFSNISDIYKLIFSLAYAFSQYVITQMSNIMWLDGVYMLPLLMLGVNRYVKNNKTTLLYLTVAATVLFNWYTGYMNCLFIPFYFFLEEYLYERETLIWNKVYFLKRSITFGIIEILGVLLSSTLFVPVIYGILQGKGEAESNIFRWITNGSFLAIVRGFVLGGPINSRDISLYCGLFVLVIATAFFFSKSVFRYEKISVFCVLAFLIAGNYFRCLENIWNGFRTVSSYYYRASYITVCFIIYIGAYIINREDKNLKPVLQKSCGIYIAIFLCLDYMRELDAKYLWLSIAVLILYIFSFEIKREKLKKLLIYSAFIAEVLINGRKAFLSIYYFDSSKYKEYVMAQTNLLETLETGDEGFYRMEETEKRIPSMANVNESMAYGYYGISHYSSAFDSVTADFMMNMGYSNQKVVSIYNEPFLPADSLLGIKYVLSEKELAGYKLWNNSTSNNNKTVYYNEYALPLGFAASEDVLTPLQGDNVFEKINNVYSDIIGYKVEILKSIDAEKKVEDGKVCFSLNGIQDEGWIYGRVDTAYKDLNLIIDGVYHSKYCQWLYQPVFNVGTNRENHQVILDNYEGGLDDVGANFYYLDLGAFQQAIDEIKNKQFANLYIEDGYIHGNYVADKEEHLVLTIPYESSWQATVNGIPTNVEMAESTFISLNVHKGENNIELRYHLKGQKQGMCLTLVSLVLYYILYYIYNSRVLKQGKKMKKFKEIRKE